MKKYYYESRQRAQRRRSLWHVPMFILAMITTVLIVFVFFQCMWLIHTLIYPDHANKLGEFWNDIGRFRSFISSFLLLVPLFFAALPLGLMFSNAVIWLIPSARRALDRGASLSEAMLGLWKVSRVIVPICLLLSLLGAVTLIDLK